MAGMKIAVRLLAITVFLILLRLPVAVAGPEIPPLTGRVVDLADILTNAAERDLTNQLVKVEQKTGVQIALVTLPALGQYAIETWGLALGRGWGIGHKGKDDGIVIVLAPNDREVRIEVGYGLEGRIPDATASKIIQAYMLPAAREHRFATGLAATIAALERVIVDPSAVPFKAPVRDTPSIVIILTMFVAVIAFIFFIVARNIRAWSESGPYQARPDERSTSVFDDDRRARGLSTGSLGSFGSLQGGSGRSFFGGGGSSFRGGGGSFGGGGASGKW